MSDKSIKPSTPTLNRRLVVKESLGVKFNINEYPDVKTLISETSEERVIGLINGQLTQLKLNEAREQFCADLEALTGIMRERTMREGKGPHIGKTITKIVETSEDFVERFRQNFYGDWHESTKTRDFKQPELKLNAQVEDVLLPFVVTDTMTGWDDFNAWLNNIASARTYTLDAKSSDRSTGGAKFSKFVLNAANQIYTGNSIEGRDSVANWAFWQKRFAKESNITLANRTGNPQIDIPALAEAIVKNDEVRYK